MAEKTRTRRKDARPEEIIDAALQEFAMKGFSGTSMASIAGRANIARSTIYLYFDDKAAVIQSAFEQRVGAAIRDALGQAHSFDAPFDQVLRRFLEGAYARFLEPDLLVLFKILISEGQQFPAMLETYHGSVLTSSEQMLRGLLSLGVSRGEVREEVPDYDVKLIIAPVIVAALWQLTFQKFDPIDLPRFIDGQVALLTRGVMK